MDLHLLGTAAAEAWPAPFCLCDACEEARRRGGPNLRGRSGALVDDDLKIDFGPDTYSQIMRLGRNLAGVRAIVFTHAHADHMALDEMRWACRPYTQTPPAQPIAVYGNEEVIAAHQQAFGDGAKVNLQFHLLRPFEAVTTPRGDRILPLPADHVGGALVLRITRAEGKTLFYGHDSGRYPKPTLDALSDGLHLDIALFDCTNGGDVAHNEYHMAVSGVVEMAGELRRRGVVDDRSRAIATHFSHNGKLLHDDLVRFFMPHNIEVAYDGMLVRAV